MKNLLIYFDFVALNYLITRLNAVDVHCKQMLIKQNKTKQQRLPKAFA